MVQDENLGFEGCVEYRGELVGAEFVHQGKMFVEN